MLDQAKNRFTLIINSRAQHRIIEVSQIFVGSVLAMEMSVKYLKVTISFTKKSVKFSSVFILPQECQLFLGFRQYERNIVEFTSPPPLDNHFQQNKTSFQLQELPLAAPALAMAKSCIKKHWNLMTTHGHRQPLSGGFLVCYDSS